MAERKHAEEALRASEARYRNVFKTAPLAIVVWDPECRVTDWNPCAEKLFGWRNSLRRDTEGRSEEVTSMALDITDRRHTEDKLRRSRARCQALYDGVPVAYLSVGTDGLVFGQEVSAQIDDAILLLSLGADYQLRESVKVRVDAHNILGWVDTDLNNRPIHGWPHFRPDLPSLSIGVQFAL